MNNFIELLKDGDKEMSEQKGKDKEYQKTNPRNVTSREWKFQNERTEKTEER